MKNTVEYKPSLAPCVGKGRGGLDEFAEQWKALGIPGLEGKAPVWQDPAEMYWTPDRGWLKASFTPELLANIRDKTNGCFHDNNLAMQCQILQVPYEQISIDEMHQSHPGLHAFKGKGIETFSTEYFRELGWQGDRAEGSTLKLITHFVHRHVKSTVRNKYGKVKIKKSKDGKTTSERTMSSEDVLEEKAELALRYQELMLEGFNLIYPNKLDEIYDVWANRHKGFPLPTCSNPDTFLKHDFLDLAHAVGDETIWRILELNYLGFGGTGWPDLTLHKDGKLKFVEIKLNNDKFTEWQPYWIRNFGKQLGFDVSVLHVKGKLKA